MPDKQDMDATKMTDPAARVCPRCGEEAAEQSFCGGCGLNLAQQAGLPSAEEYEARLRQEQWLRSQAGTSMPHGVSAARALPDPARVRARHATRSRLLGSAAAAVAVAFALNWIGAILHFVESFEAGTAWQVEYGFAVAGNLVLIPAFASAAAAFLGEASDQAPRLRRAALIAAFGFGLLMVATAISAGVYANLGSYDFITKLVAGQSLQATSEFAAAIAAAMASVAFLPSRSEPAMRNWWLGLASVALGGVFLLSMVGNIVSLSAGLNGGSSTMELGASGAGVGLVAAAIAAGAFLLARGPQERTGDWWSKRDGVLGIAQAVLALAFLLTAIGDAILAGESVAGRAIAGNWLDFGGDLSLLGAASTASIGFFIVGRLRRQDVAR